MLTKFKGQVEKVDKKYLIGGTVIGVLAVGAIIYFKTRKNSIKSDNPTPFPIPEKFNIKILDELEELESEEKLFIRVVNAIKKIMPSEDEGLGFEVVKAIYKAQFELSRGEFRKKTVANRE